MEKIYEAGVKFYFKNGDDKFIENLDICDVVKALNKVDINESPMVNFNNQVVINMKEVIYFERKEYQYGV